MERIHRLVNALTIDVEDYFHVWALAPYIPRAQWEHLPSRIERNVALLLDLLEHSGAKATFFTLGWVAERHPTVVRRIVEQGHELASHGYAHRAATEQQPGQFRSDIQHAKAILEDIGGVEVKGYRAPSFSVGPRNPWAFDCIAEAGYQYSSSIYPVRHDHYGVPDAPRFAHRLKNGLLELPISTVRLFERNWPAGGGGYFRLLPYSVSRWSLKRVNVIERQPAVFYLHPWELDPEQPRVANASPKARFRHYLNLGRTGARLRRLLSEFHWDRADRVFLEQRHGA